jgi:hypothetical protein
MERQRTPTLPERPQRGYWQFLYKYPSKYVGVVCYLKSYAPQFCLGKVSS